MEMWLVYKGWSQFCVQHLNTKEKNETHRGKVTKYSLEYFFDYDGTLIFFEKNRRNTALSLELRSLDIVW